MWCVFFIINSLLIICLLICCHILDVQMYVCSFCLFARVFGCALAEGFLHFICFFLVWSFLLVFLFSSFESFNYSYLWRLLFLCGVLICCVVFIIDLYLLICCHILDVQMYVCSFCFFCKSLVRLLQRDFCISFVFSWFEVFFWGFFLLSTFESFNYSYLWRLLLL